MKKGKKKLKRLGAGFLACMLAVLMNINPLAVIAEAIADSGFVDGCVNLKNNLIRIASGNTGSAYAAELPVIDPLGTTAECDYDLTDLINALLEANGNITMEDILEALKDENGVSIGTNVSTGFTTIVGALGYSGENTLSADMGRVDNRLQEITSELQAINSTIENMQHRYRVAHLYSLNNQFSNALWRPYSSDVPYVEDFAICTGKFANVYTGYWDSFVTTARNPGNQQTKRAYEVLGYDAIVRAQGVVLQKSLTPISTPTGQSGQSVTYTDATLNSGAQVNTVAVLVQQFIPESEVEWIDAVTLLYKALGEYQYTYQSFMAHDRSITPEQSPAFQNLSNSISNGKESEFGEGSYNGYDFYMFLNRDNVIHGVAKSQGELSNISEDKISYVYWEKAGNAGFISQGISKNDKITWSDFYKLASRMMQAYGEPEMSNNELMALLQVYGTNYPIQLGEAIADAWAYLKVRGCLAEDYGYSNTITRDQLLDVCMRIADKDSRLDYKVINITLDLADVMQDNGFYPVYDLKYTQNQFSTEITVDYSRAKDYTYLLAKTDDVKLNSSGALVVCSAMDTTKLIKGASAEADVIYVDGKEFYVVNVPTGYEGNIYIAKYTTGDVTADGTANWLEVPGAALGGGIYSGYSEKDGVATVSYREGSTWYPLSHRDADRSLLYYNDYKRAGRDKPLSTKVSSNATLVERILCGCASIFSPVIVHAENNEGGGESQTTTLVTCDDYWTGSTISDSTGSYKIDAGGGILHSNTLPTGYEFDLHGNYKNVISDGSPVRDPYSESAEFAYSTNLKILNRLCKLTEYDRAYKYFSAVLKDTDYLGGGHPFEFLFDELLCCDGGEFVLDGLAPCGTSDGHADNNDLLSLLRAMTCDTSGWVSTEAEYSVVFEKKQREDGSTKYSLALGHGPEPGKYVEVKEQYKDFLSQYIYAMGGLATYSFLNSSPEDGLKFASHSILVWSSSTSPGITNVSVDQTIKNARESLVTEDEQKCLYQMIRDYNCTATNIDGKYEIATSNAQAVADMIGAPGAPSSAETFNGESAAGVSPSVASTVIMRRDQQMLLRWTDLVNAGFVFPLEHGKQPTPDKYGNWSFYTPYGLVKVNDNQDTIQIGTTLYDLALSNGVDTTLVYVDNDEHETYLDYRCVMGTITSQLTSSGTTTSYLNNTIGAGGYVIYDLGSKGAVSAMYEVEQVSMINYPDLREVNPVSLITETKLDDPDGYWGVNKGNANRFAMTSFNLTSNYILVIKDSTETEDDTEASLFVYYPKVAFDEEFVELGSDNMKTKKLKDPTSSLNGRFDNVGVELKSVERGVDNGSTFISALTGVYGEYKEDAPWYMKMTYQAACHLFEMTGSYYLSPDYVIREFKIDLNSYDNAVDWFGNPYGGGTEVDGNVPGALYWVDGIGFIYNLPSDTEFTLEKYLSGEYALPLTMYRSGGTIEVVNYNLDYYGSAYTTTGSEKLYYGVVLSDQGFVSGKRSLGDKVLINSLYQRSSASDEANPPFIMNPGSEGDTKSFTPAPSAIYAYFARNTLEQTQVSSLDKANTSWNRMYIGSTRIVVESTDLGSSNVNFNWQGSAKYPVVSMGGSTPVNRVYRSKAGWDGYVFLDNAITTPDYIHTAQVTIDDIATNPLEELEGGGLAGILAKLDSSSSFIITIAFWVLPIIGIIFMTGLVGLSFIGDSKLVRVICSKTVDPVRILTLGHHNIETWKWKKVLIPCTLLYLAFALFLNGNLIRLLQWGSKWIGVVTQWLKHT